MHANFWTGSLISPFKSMKEQTIKKTGLNLKKQKQVGKLEAEIEDLSHET